MSTLDSFPFFQEMSADGQALLSSQARFVKAKAGASLVRKGDAVEGAYLVLEGSLRIFNICPDGRETTLYWVSRGQSCILALNSVFSSLLYPAWVEAESDTSIAIIPPALFRTLFATERPVQSFTFDTLSGLVFELITHLEQAVGGTVESRLANFLLKRANSDKELHMSHEAIAGHIGTSREVVSRTLRHFRAMDLVSTRRGCITLLNTQGLVERGLAAG